MFVIPLRVELFVFVGFQFCHYAMKNLLISQSDEWLSASWLPV
nr:MAG TPA: hypothetical protein [Caudoviricetes sp.]